MSHWASPALQRANQLRERLDQLKPASSVERERLEHRIHDIADLCSDVIDGRRVTSEKINATWNDLHTIEEQLDQLDPDTDELVRSAKSHLAEHESARAVDDFEERIRKVKDDQERRALAREEVRKQHEESQKRLVTQRASSRGIFWISMVLFAFAAGLTVVQIWSPDRFLPAPSEGTSLPPWAFLGLTILFGTLGGAVSALLSLYVSARNFQEVFWFDPRPVLTIMKVALGAWTAVIGILAVASKVIVGVYTTVPSALLLAFLFGYGQQAVTTFLDRRIAENLSTQQK